MILDASTKTSPAASRNQDMLIAHMQSTMGYAGAAVPPVLTSSCKTPYQPDRKISEPLPAYHAARPPQYTAVKAGSAKDYESALAEAQATMGFVGAPIIPEMKPSKHTSSFKFASLFKSTRSKPSKPLDLAHVNPTSSLQDRQRLAEVNWPTMQRGHSGR